MPQNPDNVIKITPPPGDKTDQESKAYGLVHLPIQAAATVTTYVQASFQDCLNELTEELTQQIIAVNQGNLYGAEGLLISQAHTLNIMFHRLAQRAQAQEYIPNFESLLKLALRAQNQCRATLETLSTLKNPPNVAFIRQANVAHNQQVNNGARAGPTPPAKDSTPQLEQTDGNYLDPRTATMASGNDPAMATVGEIHRPEDRRGQG